MAASGPNEAEVNAWLGKLKVSSGDSDILTADDTEQAADVFERLLENNVLSVPVCDGDSGVFYGFVDMFDFVQLAVDSIAKTELMAIRGESQVAKISQSLAFTKQLKEVVNLSDRNPWRPILEGAPLADLINLLGNESHRRVCIVNDGASAVLGLMSQSWLVAWLNENIDHVLNTDTTLAECCATHDQADDRHAPDELVTVKASATALAAFRALLEAGVSSLPIVDDETGRLVSYITGRDLKAIVLASGRCNFSFLFDNVVSFVNRSHGSEAGTDLEAITCTGEETVAEAIEKLAQTREHRLIMVDEDGLPTDVVSLRDIIRVILHL